MPIMKSENVLDVGSDRVVDETSDERFDRAAFARRAIDLVQPRRMIIAICEGTSRLRVESGRMWGVPRPEPDDPSEPGERWAMLAIPPRASRRAIALAVAELAASPRAYTFDLLMAEAAASLSPLPPAPPSEPGVT
jgi:hypothetical protein